MSFQQRNVAPTSHPLHGGCFPHQKKIIQILFKSFATLFFHSQNALTFLGTLKSRYGLREVYLKTNFYWRRRKVQAGLSGTYNHYSPTPDQCESLGKMFLSYVLMSAFTFRRSLDLFSVRVNMLFFPRIFEHQTCAVGACKTHRNNRCTHKIH